MVQAVKRRKAARILLGLTAATAVTFIIAFAAVQARPDLGAKTAVFLRKIIGNQGVAALETIVFKVEDAARQAQYDAGLEQAEAPWQLPSATPSPTPPPTLAPTMTPSPPPLPTEGADLAESAASTAVPTATPTPIPPTATPTAVPLPFPTVAPFGDLAGEGEWQPYLRTPAGETAAVRTFLQPDPERPYAIVAVVAFDLSKTELHYVLGSEEPSLPDGPRGYGLIDAAHKEAGKLLATFNGAFMATHGEYGAMAHGVTALPAKNVYATIGLFADGRLQIGRWGEDLLPDADYVFWRQNARLIVADGAINEKVYNGSARTWGSSIEGDVTTWRSGIGLNEDRTILYFFAGPSLSMPALAEAMTAVSVENGMLLDINQSWVHFAAVHADGEEWVAEPLLPEGMETNVDRYLKQSPRDFFYVTVKDGD